MTKSVYAIRASGNYGGGMAIVAAENEKMAMELATGIDKNWFTKYHKPDSIEKLPLFFDGECKVLTHFETGE